MTSVLWGKELAKKIRAMFAEERPIRCAVAFWGPEVAELARKNDAEVILDISMGGTAKNALFALGVPDNRKIRVLDNLHSKIYLGASGAIVGSANASSSALGSFNGKPRLEEAGVWIPQLNEPQAYREVEKLFVQYRKRSKRAKQSDLDRAPFLSRNRAARDQNTNVSDHVASIFALLKTEPDRFESTAFIFGDQKADVEDKKEAKSAYDMEFPIEKGDSKRSLICTYCDADENLILEECAFVIMYWFGRGLDIYAYHDIVRVQVEKDVVAFFGKRHWPTIRNRLDLAFPHNKAEYWKSDSSMAHQFLTEKCGDKRGKRFWIMSYGELYATLESSK